MVVSEVKYLIYFMRILFYQEQRFFYQALPGVPDYTHVVPYERGADPTDPKVPMVRYLIGLINMP